MKEMKTKLISERIAKKIARSGLCSRRKAESLILEGKVILNNKIVKQCNVNVNDTDIILINGKPLPKSSTSRLWMFFKQRGYLVTENDPQGRPTIFQKLKSKTDVRLISIGRLDMNSEGLLLLTNDGKLARKFELPSNAMPRIYRVRVHGIVKKQHLMSLYDGITIDGIKYRSISAKVEKQTTSNAWITMKLIEGKNREIRKIMSYFGYRVNKLIRTSFGPFSIKSMKPGDLIEVNQKKINQSLKYKKVV